MTAFGAGHHRLHPCRGEVYDDRTGPVIVGWLSDRGYDVTEQVVVADGHAVGDALRRPWPSAST